MSRILRRPMFRGGRVNSYGTGIASGLADGGRVGFRTGGSYLSQAITPSAVTEAYKPQGISPGFLEFLRGDIYSGQNRMPDFSKINREGLAGIEDYGVIPTEEVNQFKDLDLDTGERKKYASIPSTSDAVEKVETETEEVIEPGLGDTGIATQTMAEFEPEEPELKKQRTVKQPTLKETEDNEVTMTDLERALGLDDARKEYVGDALAAASKAFFEGRGFEAISDAAQVKSKAPEIKRLAGLEEFKAKKAQDLYKTKLEAQAKQKEGTKGALQKDIDFIKSQPEGSQGQILALKKFGFEPDIGSEISARKMKGVIPNLTQLGRLYFPQSFKGVVSGDATPEVDGTYIIEGGTGLLIVEGGVSRPQPF